MIVRVSYDEIFQTVLFALSWLWQVNISDGIVTYCLHFRCCYDSLPAHHPSGSGAEFMTGGTKVVPNFFFFFQFYRSAMDRDFPYVQRDISIHRHLKPALERTNSLKIELLLPDGNSLDWYRQRWMRLYGPWVEHGWVWIIWLIYVTSGVSEIMDEQRFRTICHSNVMRLLCHTNILLQLNQRYWYSQDKDESQLQSIGV